MRRTRDPHRNRKVAVVTGANRGLGLAPQLVSDRIARELPDPTMASFQEFEGYATTRWPSHPLAIWQLKWQPNVWL